MLFYIVFSCYALCFQFAKGNDISNEINVKLFQNLVNESEKLQDLVNTNQSNSSDIIPKSPDEIELHTGELNNRHYNKQFGTSLIAYDGMIKSGQASGNSKKDDLEPENRPSDTQISAKYRDDIETPVFKDDQLQLQSPGSPQIKDLKLLKLEPGFKLTTTEMASFKIWPQGIIPCFIDDFSYGKVLRDKIREHLDDINSLTGLQFLELQKPPDDDQRWVLFVNRRAQLHCSDYNQNSFTISGVQKVVLGYDCLNDGGAIAALTLALAGVPPQHNSPDRDQFIKVTMESIIPDKTKLFEKVEDHEWIFFDIQYDFLSAGHYPWYKYNAGGSATIIPLKLSNGVVGEAYSLSYTDIQKIRMLYKFVVSERLNKVNFMQCNTLFRLTEKNDVIKLVTTNEKERLKPKLYMEGVKKAGLSKTDYYSQSIIKNVDRSGIKMPEINDYKNNDTDVTKIEKDSKSASALVTRQGKKQRSGSIINLKGLKSKKDNSTRSNEKEHFMRHILTVKYANSTSTLDPFTLSDFRTSSEKK